GKTQMRTVRHRLSGKPDTADFADRDYRRQLAVLIEDKALAELLGLARLRIAQVDLLGDPVELAFDFTGDNDAAAAMRLKPFLDGIESIARSQRNMIRLHRSAVMPPAPA